MTREQRIVETFVALADTMVDEFDVVDFLHVLADRAVELLDCGEAGILLADAAGLLRVMASSSERSDALELLQSQNEEGPCFDCYASGRTVMTEDLQDEAGRWPTFAPAAIENGFRSVQALPMRAHGHTIGGLNLFRAAAGGMDQPDLTLAQGMADIAAVALLQERAFREARDVVSQLQSALNSRVVIEQATGILAERSGIGVDAAFAQLRAHARNRNRRLSDLARQLIGGQLDTHELDVPAPSADR